jgi:8-oxo-dGTP pyrophosphatase MutT (NUDIX family)
LIFDLDNIEKKSFIYFRPNEINTRLPNAGSQNVRPRDAATLIVFDERGREPRVLMGQRNLTHKFLPGKFVFPGGRVEPQDYVATIGCHLPKTMKGKLLNATCGVAHPQRAYAFVHAALRETREETGLIIGTNDPISDEDGAGAVPDFSDFVFVGRAITPSRRVRRFDTRFFAVSASAITGHLGSADGEFIASHWFTLDEARRLDLPVITRLLLNDFDQRLKAGNLRDPNVAVPFYFMRGLCFFRQML